MSKMYVVADSPFEGLHVLRLRRRMGQWRPLTPPMPCHKAWRRWLELRGER